MIKSLRLLLAFVACVCCLAPFAWLRFTIQYMKQNKGCTNLAQPLIRDI